MRARRPGGYVFGSSTAIRGPIVGGVVQPRAPALARADQEAYAPPCAIPLGFPGPRPRPTGIDDDGRSTRHLLSDSAISRPVVESSDIPYEEKLAHFKTDWVSCMVLFRQDGSSVSSPPRYEQTPGKPRTIFSTRKETRVRHVQNVYPGVGSLGIIRGDEKENSVCSYVHIMGCRSFQGVRRLDRLQCGLSANSSCRFLHEGPMWRRVRCFHVAVRRWRPSRCSVQGEPSRRISSSPEDCDTFHITTAIRGNEEGSGVPANYDGGGRVVKFRSKESGHQEAVKWSIKCLYTCDWWRAIFHCHWAAMA
ncbi:hypothetical protein BC827DRAFT_1155922 [Russula dissimulans]|nr:hypothetical protein BC827DRAFT_1155922 [Russula dissimulans]